MMDQDVKSVVTASFDDVYYARGRNVQYAPKERSCIVSYRMDISRQQDSLGTLPFDSIPGLKSDWVLREDDEALEERQLNVKKLKN